jgi:hypothetical protein
VRSLVEVAHSISRARGDVVQVMIGIPFFYRQFGYVYSIPIADTRRLLESPPAIEHEHERDIVVRNASLADLEAMTALVRDLAQHEVRRHYAALVWSVPTESRFKVEAPIGRDPISRIKMAVVASGKPARTDVEVLASKDGISAVHCLLHTGRTHQIRVHLASRGHPLLADATYGGRPALGMQRQALHAFELGLTHPLTREPLSFQAPLPSDLESAWAHVLAR